MREKDVVLIPGDISWAMKLEDARPDLDAICNLPGKKIMIKGNHDYWWGSLAKVNAMLHNDTYILQNNCLAVGKWVFAVRAGGLFPRDSSFGGKRFKNLRTRKIRLSFLWSPRKSIRIMKNCDDAFSAYLKKHEKYRVCTDSGAGRRGGSGVRTPAWRHFKKYKFNGCKNGWSNYNLVSADYLDFKLKRIR